MTGPRARARPETAAQTPSASARVSRSGYTCRMMDSVPGSLAAAPTPMMTRPAINQSTLLARAATTDPAQKIATPASMTRLAAQDVAQRPRRQHEAGEGQGVAVDHPLQGRDAGVQIALDVGQTHADDRVVKKGEEQDGAQGRQCDRLCRRAQPPLLDVEPGGRPAAPADCPMPTVTYERPLVAIGLGLPCHAVHA